MPSVPDANLGPEVRAVVRRAVDDRITELARQIDETQAFSPELWAILSDLGVMGIPIPNEHGGAGGSFSDYAVAVEELARGGITAAAYPGTTVQVATAVLQWGTPEQVNAWVQDLATGRKIAAWAFTEPSTGTDPKQIETRADPSDDGWLLHGEKTFTTLAAQADVALVFARAGTVGNLSAFVVDTSGPGWQPGPPFKLLAGGGAGTAPVAIENMQVGPEALLGKEGDGFDIMLSVEAEAKIAGAATCVGLGQRALEEATRYALQRTHRDVPIAHKFGSIQQMLGNMAASLDGARALTYDAARMRDVGDNVDRIAASARIVAARMAREATGAALEICGAYGFTKDMDVERLYREGKFYEVLQGVVQIQRLIVAKDVIHRAGKDGQ